MKDLEPAFPRQSPPSVTTNLPKCHERSMDGVERESHATTNASKQPSTHHGRYCDEWQPACMRTLSPRSVDAEQRGAGSPRAKPRERSHRGPDGPSRKSRERSHRGLGSLKSARTKPPWPGRPSKKSRERSHRCHNGSQRIRIARPKLRKRSHLPE